jgi:RNA-binding protein 26
VPIFDGDPEKLALYIVALSKKVENDQGSKERCINDLEVFLELNTHSFVDTLFEALLTKSYLSSASSSSNTNETHTKNDNASNQTQSSSSNNNNHTKNTPTSQSDLSRRISGSAKSGGGQHQANSSTSKGRSRDYQEIDVSISSNLSNSRSLRTNAHGGHGRRRKNRSRNRLHRDSSSSSSSSPTTISSSSRRYGNRNRSRSNSSYSRSRSNSPKNNTKIADNNSSSLIGGNKKQRCRDFDEKGFCTMAELCPYDHGEVVIAPLIPTTNQPLAGGPSPQQQPQIPYTNQNFNNNNGNPYNNHHQRGGNNMKPRRQGMPSQQFAQNTAMQQQQRFNNSNFNNNQQQNHNNNNNNNSNTNLIPGSSQQHQQQTNLINNQSQSDILFNRQQQQQQQQGNRPRNLVSIPTGHEQPQQQQQSSSSMDSNYNSQHQQPPPPRHGTKRIYNNGGNGNNNSFNQQFPAGQAALLPTPNQVNQMSSSNILPQTSLPPQSSTQRQNIDNTTENTHTNTNTDPSLNNAQQIKQKPQVPVHHSHQTQSSNPNTTLIVKKIPLDLNRMDKLQQHFTKFGQLVDIQCQFEQMPDTALIKFASNPQAFAAYKCPQPVFNNRFIRLYWYNNYQKQQQQHQHQHNQNQNPLQHLHQSQLRSDEPPVKKLAKERLEYNKSNPSEALSNELLNKENQSNRNQLNQDGLPPTMTAAKDESQQISSNFDSQLSLKNEHSSSSLAFANAATLAVKKTNYEKYMSAKLLQDENHKKTLLLKMDVQQKARELIEKQIKDQKLLLQKFEQAKSVEEKSLILSLVKKLSESIEKEKDILSNKRVIPKAPIVPSNNTTTTTTTTIANPMTVQHQSSTESNQELKQADSSGGSGSASPSIFNNTNNNASPFSFQKNPHVKAAHQLSIPPAPHHLKLDNTRLNSTNFLKHGMLQQQQQQQQQLQNHHGVISNTTQQSMFSFSRVSVDNRPKILLVTCLESNGQEKGQIINFISSLGCQIENVLDLPAETQQDKEQAKDKESNGDDEAPAVTSSGAISTSKSFIICFFTRKDAEVALTKCTASLTSKSISLTWSRQTQESLAKLELLQKKMEEESLALSSVAANTTTISPTTAEITTTTTTSLKNQTEIDKNSDTNLEKPPATTKPEINIIKEINETNIKELIDSVSNDDDDDDEDAECDTEKVNEYENENDPEEVADENLTNDSESREYSISNLIKSHNINKNSSQTDDPQEHDNDDDVFDSLFGRDKKSALVSCSIENDQDNADKRTNIEVDDDNSNTIVNNENSNSNVNQENSNSQNVDDDDDDDDDEKQNVDNDDGINEQLDFN